VHASNAVGLLTSDANSTAPTHAAAATSATAANLPLLPAGFHAMKRPLKNLFSFFFFNVVEWIPV
jgi:hypothetical protein